MNEKEKLKLLKRYNLKSISKDFEFENFYIIRDEFFNHGILISYKWLFFCNKPKASETSVDTLSELKLNLFMV